MLHEKLIVFFCDKFGEKYRAELCLETTMDHIDEWDSLSFVSVIIELEQSFGVKIGPNDAIKMKKLSEIQQFLIEREALE